MSTFSKPVICIVMLRGRHRGLPVALDRVIVFPTVFMHKTSEKVRKMKTDRRVEGASALRIGSGRGEKLRSVNEDAIS
jgi:Cation transport protein